MRRSYLQTRRLALPDGEFLVSSGGLSSTTATLPNGGLAAGIEVFEQVSTSEEDFAFGRVPDKGDTPLMYGQVPQVIFAYS